MMLFSRLSQHAPVPSAPESQFPAKAETWQPLRFIPRYGLKRSAAVGESQRIHPLISMKTNRETPKQPPSPKNDC
jgi:hypothetical protein